jgi:L-seryl-tRNA(Ser) seleniumtransferase
MEEFRHLPKVDELAKSPELALFPLAVRVRAARAAVEVLRGEIKEGNRGCGTAAELGAELAQRMSEPSIRSTINLSGVILHTGLGRARLAPSVAAHVAAVAASHSAVEIDLGTGRRGDRQEHVRELLCLLTGAEDALVVNNAAAGVFLTLSALCGRLEVILSRGQMVEIGGSFRMPDIVTQSGCRLVEVGCTNKTRMSDYEEAIGEDTMAILRCHPSNFKIVGFTEEPSIQELAGLSKQHDILLIDDQGSGCLIDLTRFGLPAQPTLPGSIAGGADITIASGDKLLGGPQCGMIVGKKVLIAQIKSHPLARVARVDKLTLAGLEATLRLYSEGREAEIPTIRYLSRSAIEIKKMAIALAKAYKPGATVEEGFSEVGGGSVPGESLATWRVCLSAPNPELLAKELRTGKPAIIGRIEQDKVWLDPRTLDESEVQDVVRTLSNL